MREALHRISNAPMLGVCALAALLAGACSATPDAAPIDSSRISPEYNREGKLTRLSYDSDGDGTVDTWGFMDGSRVVRVEIDENHDGKVDRWEFHRAATPDAAGNAGPARSAAGTGPTPASINDRTIERIERATNHDGKVTRKEFFDDGVLTRVEEDTDGDGMVDKWETYENGALRTMALDTSHRGTPDRRLVYAPGGAFLRIEADPSGSGTFTPITP